MYITQNNVFFVDKYQSETKALNRQLRIETATRLGIDIATEDEDDNAFKLFTIKVMHISKKALSAIIML